MESFIQSAVVAAINDRCQCGFTDAYVSGEKLYCDCQSATQVVYRANISSYGRYSSDDLVGLIENWVRGGPSVPSGIHQVVFDSTFPVRIASDDDPVCTSSSIPPTQRPVIPEASQVNLPAVISAAVIGVLLILILLVIGFMCLLLMRAQRRRYAGIVIAVTTANNFIQLLFPGLLMLWAIQQLWCYQTGLLLS